MIYVRVFRLLACRDARHFLFRHLELPSDCLYYHAAIALLHPTEEPVGHLLAFNMPAKQASRALQPSSHLAHDALLAVAGGCFGLFYASLHFEMRSIASGYPCALAGGRLHP